MTTQKGNDMTKGAGGSLKIHLMAAAAVVAAGAAPAAAMAADAGGAHLEEVIVTATKSGATQMQKTAIAMSAVTAADVERSGLTNVKDLVQFTPSLQAPQNNVFAQIYIRGIGSNNIFNGSDPSSTVQVDGVYIARPFAQFGNFLDVERVEVLRGPQGTLYGRNSVGGTINVISRAPSETLTGRVQLVAGNYGIVQEQAYVSGPIVADKVLFSVAQNYLRHDPFRENITPGGNDVDSQDQGSVRAQLLVRPTDRIEATTRVDLTYADYSPMGYAKILRPYDAATNSILGDYSKVALNSVGSGLVTTGGVAEEVNVRLDGGMSFKSITAYRRNTTKTFTDTDSTDRPITYSLTGERQSQFSQEFNLSGKTDRLDYVLGLYYLNEKIRTNSIISQLVAGTYTGIFPSSLVNAYAVYAQGSYHFTDRLSAIVGGRYSTEEKIFNGNVGSYVAATRLPNGRAPTIYRGKGEYEAFTPKIGLDYRFTDRIFGYASATRGFKSGGFNQTSTTAAASLGFAPEKLWSYEAGLKTEWLDRRLRLNGTVFHYDYTDLQVQNFITPGVTDISNAATAKVDGVELEAAAKPTQNLSLTANLAYLDARYDYFPRASGAGGVTIDASGNRLSASPEWSGNLVAQYDWPLATGAVISLRGEAFYQSRSYFVASNDPLQSQGAYSLFNGSLTYSFPDNRTQIALWGRNLGDEQYVTGTATISPVVSGRPGEPRTFGVRIDRKL
jgi:iron complex outermembrane receptor protein